MTHRYDQAVARHYAAFRPPLHEVILQRLVPPSHRYETGLDVGCGTGRSAVALAKHCRHVTAIDPSSAMLALATPHVGISYHAVDCTGLVQSGAATFACITFAGSLVYAKGPQLRAALSQLLAPGGHILIYDFEVLLDEVICALGLARSPSEASPYDHALRLADWPEFLQETGGAEEVRLDVSAEQLAHLALADSDRYDRLQRSDASADLFRSTARRIAERFGPTALSARIYFARYGWARRSTAAPAGDSRGS